MHCDAMQLIAAQAHIPAHDYSMQSVRGLLMLDMVSRRLHLSLHDIWVHPPIHMLSKGDTHPIKALCTPTNQATSLWKKSISPPIVTYKFQLIMKIWPSGCTLGVNIYSG